MDGPRYSLLISLMSSDKAELTGLIGDGDVKKAVEYILNGKETMCERHAAPKPANSICNKEEKIKTRLFFYKNSKQ